MVKDYYPRLRHQGVPKWLALLGTQLLTPYRRLSRYPSLHTPDAVRIRTIHRAAFLPLQTMEAISRITGTRWRPWMTIP